jgi:hypothetical protein
MLKSFHGKNRAFYGLIFGAVIFILWLPVYLSYFPGVFAYDISLQTGMIIGNEPFTSQQPVLHTLFWKWMMGLGSLLKIKDIVLYSIIQMLLVVLCLSKALGILIKQGASKVSIILMTAFLALNPLPAFFSFSTCKNILFGAFMALWSVEIWKCIKFGDCRFKSFLSLSVISLLGCLFLNNFVYVLFVFTVISLIVYRKSDLKKVSFSGIAAIIFFLIITKAVYPAAGIKEGPKAEMLSVPLQQMVYVQMNGGLSEEETETLKSFFIDNDWGYYRPGNVDVIKGRFLEEEFAKRKSEFFSLYFSAISSKPKEAMGAFVRLNAPLWNPFIKDIGEYSDKEYLESFSFEGEPKGYEGFSRDSKWPALYEKFESLTHYTTPLKNNLFFTILFSAALPLWIMIVCAVVLLVRKQGKYLPVLLPYFLLIGTHLLGPLASMRYVYPLILFLPFAIYVSVKRD